VPLAGERTSYSQYFINLAPDALKQSLRWVCALFLSLVRVIIVVISVIIIIIIVLILIPVQG
jgi:hypothetical protein